MNEGAQSETDLKDQIDKKKQEIEEFNRERIKLAGLAGPHEAAITQHQLSFSGLSGGPQLTQQQLDDHTKQLADLQPKISENKKNLNEAKKDLRSLQFAQFKQNIKSNFSKKFNFSSRKKASIKSRIQGIIQAVTSLFKKKPNQVQEENPPPAPRTKEFVEELLRAREDQIKAQRVEWDTNGVPDDVKRKIELHKDYDPDYDVDKYIQDQLINDKTIKNYKKELNQMHMDSNNLLITTKLDLNNPDHLQVIINCANDDPLLNQSYLELTHFMLAAAPLLAQGEIPEDKLKELYDQFLGPNAPEQINVQGIDNLKREDLTDKKIASLLKGAESVLKDSVNQSPLLNSRFNSQPDTVDPQIEAYCEAKAALAPAKKEQTQEKGPLVLSGGPKDDQQTFAQKREQQEQEATRTLDTAGLPVEKKSSTNKLN